MSPATTGQLFSTGAAPGLLFYDQWLAATDAWKLGQPAQQNQVPPRVETSGHPHYRIQNDHCGLAYFMFNSLGSGLNFPSPASFHNPSNHKVFLPGARAECG
jgi:hypothetical protein